MRISTHVSATADRASDQLTPPGSDSGAAPMVAAGARRQQSGSGRAFVRIVRSPTGLVGLAIVASLALAGLFAPLLAPYDPIAMRAGAELQPPSAAHPMGTDDFGRDVLSRVIFGSRLSLAVSVVGVLLSAASGISLGLLAGYFGGVADAVLMRFTDLLFAFPSILLGIAVAAVLGAGAINTIWVVTIVYIPLFARLARASMLTERARDYVLAARALGASSGRIIVGHVVPNCLAPLLVQFTVALSLAVLLEASLGFIGLGAQVPEPSWGAMLNDSRRYLRQAPWYGVFPGVALTALVLGLNLLSDALRDALDPRRFRRGR